MSLLLPSRPSARRSALVFLLVASFTGVTFHVLFVTTGAHQAVREAPVLKDWLPAPPPRTTKVVFTDCPAGWEPDLSSPETPTRVLPHGALPPSSKHQDDNWDLDRVRKMVATTKGYYARDYSLGLGWNNVRYIIEAALLHSYTLNRTLILPSFVYARACEHEINVCAAFATMVNKGDAIGWDQWRKLPMVEQMGWRIPIEHMLDLPNLRKTFSVVLVREYLQLHGLDPGVEWSNGAWDQSEYHKGTNPKSSLSVIENKDFDPAQVTRVDDLTVFSNIRPSQGPVHESLMRALGSKPALDWEEAKRTSPELLNAGSDENIIKLLEENGWATLHTYESANGMDLMKAVIVPTRQVTPYPRLKGLVDDYGSVKEDVLLLRGETHLGRKPGGLRFTTPAARDKFTQAVLHSIRPPDAARNLAAVLHDRMMKRAGGRMWMSAHMRRGDFVKLGWAADQKIENHLNRVKDRLERGRETLRTIHASKELQKYNIPNATADMDQLRLGPPRRDDPFYIATDERSLDDLKYLRANGAVLISDLLEPEDRRDFGWGIMLTDILSVVEQALLARAYFFYAHAISSVAGGALNLRAARGVDPRTTVFD